MSETIIVAGRRVKIDGTEGYFYIANADFDDARYVQKDGKWHSTTGFDRGYWPTEAAAREFARSLAARSQPAEGADGLIYLASPYSHADTSIRDRRFDIVCKAAARLMSEGHLIFSPIAHTHPIAMAGSLPTGWDFWQKYDHAQLDAAAELWVLTIDGWQESKGVTGEIAYMESIGKPVRYVEVVRSDLEPLPTPPVPQEPSNA